MKNTSKTHFKIILMLGFMLYLILGIALIAGAQTKVKLVGDKMVSVTQNDSATHVYCPTCGSIKTTFTFTTKDGDVLPVWKSKNDKFFVIRKSKAGNEYKQYLITE